MRRFDRILKWTGLAIVLAFAWYAYGPTWPDDPRDDRCTFGSVSNERYQEFVDAALKKKDTGEWQPIPMWFWNGNPRQYGEVGSAFQTRIESILPLAKSND